MSRPDRDHSRSVPSSTRAMARTPSHFISYAQPRSSGGRVPAVASIGRNWPGWTCRPELITPYNYPKAGARLQLGGDRLHLGVVVQDLVPHLAAPAIRSPIFQTSRPRSDGVIRLQGPSSKALRAAFTARLTSSAPPSATRARVSPVAGSGVSNVLPDAASDHCPLMNSWRGVLMNSSTLRSRVT